VRRGATPSAQTRARRGPAVCGRCEWAYV
jgi:hypothetical protein